MSGQLSVSDVCNDGLHTCLCVVFNLFRVDALMPKTLHTFICSFRINWYYFRLLTQAIKNRKTSIKPPILQPYLACWDMLIASSAIVYLLNQNVERERKTKPLGLDYPYCNGKCLLDVTWLWETNYYLSNEQHLGMSILGKSNTEKL